MTERDETNDQRLARWFLSRSDLDAFNQLVWAWGETPDWVIDPVFDLAPWRAALTRQEDLYREAGEIECATDFNLAALGSQGRISVAVNWLNDRLDVQNVMDFGCSRGNLTIPVALRCGRKWTGVDIDVNSILEAKRLAAELAPHRDLTFRVEKDAAEFEVGEFDAVLAFDILEHVADAKETLVDLESATKKGGWIVGCVPYGPVEYAMWIERPERLREHIREWTPKDLHEMFGHRMDYGHVFISYGNCKYTRQELGHTIFWYRVGHDEAGGIDWQRKLNPLTEKDIWYTALPL